MSRGKRKLKVQDNPMTSSQAGKEFENEVANMLSLANFVVRRESIIGHKRVDLYIEEKRLGSLRRIAVECKSRKKPLTQAEVSVIYSNYLPLCDQNLIDEILLVTSAGLSPSAMAMVQASRNLTHMTSDEIFDLVMDFGLYLQGLQRQFDENGLSFYYIPPLATNGENFEKLIIDWIEAPGSAPLAILGSYGTGKTTLAKRMASRLAAQIAPRRIPILVKLGDIAAEQTLEGLLGKLFTAHSVVKNYSFNLFMSLNSQGRFVILLDGFDEMKQTLTWAEFRYNLRQLNRLVNKNSKVAILGRPTAFLNDDEYRYALRGIRLVGTTEIREPDWPVYTELHLASFSEEQARIFLRKYLTYKIDVTDIEKEKEKMQRVIDEQIESLFDGEFSDLSRRPVQLKILAEVLPNWKGEFRDLTVSRLYSYFIDLIIEREQEKLARKRFDLATRRIFARDLAMFLWLNKGQMGVSITADKIPEELVLKHALPGDDLEALKRDLVAACFLDRKLGDSLFFPHRSFQEFLVAECLVQDLTTGEVELQDASEVASEEIIDFMEDLIDSDTVLQWEEKLEKTFGLISRRFAEIWLNRKESVAKLWKRLEEASSPWPISLLAIGARTGRVGHDMARRLVTTSIERITGTIGQDALVYLWCVILLGDQEAIGEALRRLTWVESHNRPGERDAMFVPERSVTQVLSAVNLDEKRLTVNLDEVYSVLIEELARHCFIGEREGSRVVFFDTQLPKVVMVTAQAIAALVLYKEKYCNKKWMATKWQRGTLRDRDTTLIDSLRKRTQRKKDLGRTRQS